MVNVIINVNRTIDQTLFNDNYIFKEGEDNNTTYYCFDYYYYYSLLNLHGLEIVTFISELLL